MNGYLLASLIVFLAVALVGVVCAARVYASGDGEGLQKVGMQGLFVPLNAENIAGAVQPIEERQRTGDGEP